MVAVQVLALVAGMPLTAQAEPTTTGLIIAMLIVSAISTGASLAVGAIMGAFRKPKPGTVPTLQITSAREGEGIPRVYGTFSVGAKVIDRGSPATTRTVTQGSGKRRGPPTTAYSASLMLMACENLEDTILGVSRIFVDGEVRYSVDPTSLNGTNPAVLGTANGPFRDDLCSARRMQILLGQSTQTDRCDWFATGGDDTVPAYRGVVTICLDDMDFEPFYNRIPQFQVEVVQGVGSSAPYPALYECHLAGLSDTQINIASNPGYGLGLAIEGPQPFKSLLELSPDVCVAEVDGELKFMAIPAASSATVTAGELGVIQTGREDVEEQPVKFAMSIEQSATVTSRIEVTYLDPDNKYQAASVGYARQYGVARGVTHLQVPIAHTRASAQSYASKFIARSWTERDTLKFSLLPKYIKYHPGDVLTITAPDSTLIDCRILTMDFKPGTHPVEITAVRQLRGQGVGNPDDFMPEVPAVSDEVERLASVSVLSNVPPLVDDHDTFDGIYWAAGPLTTSTTTPVAEWKGAVLYRNACGSDDTNKLYEAVGYTRTSAVIGKAKTALANGTGTDTVNTVDVDFPFGDGTDTVVSIHDNAFTATTTANLAILGKEVIQFRDVSDVSATYSLPAGRVWRLQGKIKRGLRDTTAFASTHAITNEVQTLTFGGTITGGTFLLTFNGATTAAISWSSTNATLVANIDNALGALASIGGVANVTTAVGTMTAGIGTITVTFTGDLAGTDVPLMTKDSTNLTGTAPTLTVSLTTEGQGEAFVLWNPDAVIRVPLNFNEAGGTYNFKTLSLGQDESEVYPIPFTFAEGGATTMKSTTP